ncbi:MAG: hypothetical protein ACLFVJ_14145, partial [Persicimonas sp.]
GDGEPACASNTTCEDNRDTQSCMYSDGTCAPANFGMEGDLMLGQVIGDYSQNPESKVHIMAKAADHAEVDTGLSLALRMGAQPDDFGRCVAVDPTARPSLEPIAPSPSIYTDARPDGEPFMMGIGLHKRSVEQILWSTWGGGALCLKVDSEAVDQLSTDTLGTLLPSMKTLAGGDAQVYLQIAPQESPTVKLGDNQVTEDGDSYVIDDPLMTLDWRDLDMHFYVYAHERFVRMFSLRADMLLPIALAADGQGSIIPALGDLEEAVTNIRPVKTELLQEDPQTIIDLIPTLMSFALPSLAGSISEPIELPEFFGYRIALEQDDITSVDERKMIALYADLVEADTQAYAMSLDTTIYSTGVDIPEWTESGVPRPKATLDVAAELPAWAGSAQSDDLEYSYRVDGGIWSMYHRAERLEIQDPMLVLEGRHRIEVRARFRGQPETTEREPAATFVTVDYAAPDFSVERDGPTVRLLADDTVDEAEDLMYRYRVVDGIEQSRWTPWQSRDTIDLREIDAPEHFRLVAQVKDRSGHVAEDDQNVVWEPMAYQSDMDEPTEGQLDDDKGQPTAGCQSGGQAPPVGAGGLLALLGAALLVWRRPSRRLARRVGMLLAVVSLLGLSACSDDTAGGETSNGACEDGCAEGEECVDGACEPVDTAECEADDECGDCPEGDVAFCSDGACECRPACEEGCGEDEFCCYESDSCQSIPDPCADELCDPGFEPEVADPGTPDSATCEVTGAQCECVSLPPLPLGIHGPYASVAERDGVRAASVYNQTYTDLMVATVDDSGEPTWHFVDGVPESGDIEGDLDGPRGGISDSGDDVGTHTAIGVDGDGNLHVLYRDEDEGALKYARGTSGDDGLDFELKTLDDAGDTGFYSSLVVDDDGTVHAVYTAFEVEDADEGWQTQLRYLNFPADAAMDELAPEPSTVYGTATDNPCGGACDRFELCFDGACSEPTDDCDDDCGDGLECYAGACEPYYSRGKRAYPMMTGLFSHLSITEQGLAVTFYDHLQQQVGWSQRTDDQWSEAQFLGAPSGPYVSGTVDADGEVHLAYMEPEKEALVYEVVGSGDRETIASGIRDTADGYLLSQIGEDIELKLHDDGSVQVLYQDATWHKLNVASRDDAGDWTVDTLSQPSDPYEGAHGFFATMVRNPSSSDLAVEFVLDRQADPEDGRPEFHALD